MHQIRQVGLSLRKCGGGLLANCKSSYGRGWILCRRLEWERGTVSGRVALLLRSAEVKPFVLKICSTVMLNLSYQFFEEGFTWGLVFWTYKGDWFIWNIYHKGWWPCFLFPVLHDLAEKCRAVWIESTCQCCTDWFNGLKLDGLMLIKSPFHMTDKKLRGSLQTGLSQKSKKPICERAKVWVF